MATLTVSGNNSSYTLSLSGMSTSTRYHVFVADLSSSGSVTGYKCVRSSLGSSSTWTYNGSSNSPYSSYSRSVYVYTSTAATSHSVGTIYTYDEMRSGCTFMDSDTIPAAGSSGYDTNAISFRAGEGIKSYKIRYDSKTETGVTSGLIQDITVQLFIRDGTNASLMAVNYADGYGSSFQFVEYTNSQFTTIKKYFEENDGYVTSNGTRYLMLTAASLPYFYKVHAFGNGGTFTNQDGADNYYTSLATSTTVSVDFDLTTLETPYRAGYTFLGWGYTSNATTYYKNRTIPISVTSKSSSDPTIYNLFAIWEKRTDTMHIKMGTGITSMSVYVDNELKARIQDRVYHDIAVHTDSTITVKSIAKASGYTKPYIFRFYQNASATTTDWWLTDDTDEPSYTYSTNRFYAELSATKGIIDLFYWINEASDDSLIAKGEPVKNITAARWNSLKAKIKELADAQGISYSYSNVSSGSTFSATEFNNVRNAIDKFDGAGALPPIKNSGDQILASFFNGTASLKAALNRAITTHNNS